MPALAGGVCWTEITCTPRFTKLCLWVGPPPDWFLQDWVTLMDAGSGEWKESVQLVFEYFCERTPRSFVEQRGTSLVWNYKYAGETEGRVPGRQAGRQRQGRGWQGGAAGRS